MKLKLNDFITSVLYRNTVHMRPKFDQQHVNLSPSKGLSQIIISDRMEFFRFCEII